VQAISLSLSHIFTRMFSLELDPVPFKLGRPFHVSAFYKLIPQIAGGLVMAEQHVTANY
jgi:hypothetical protein